MNPWAELPELASAKAELRRTIARRRESCAAAAASVVRPLRWIDTALALWRSLPPLAQLLPLAAAAGAASSRPSLFGRLLRWGPVAWGMVSALRRQHAVARSEPNRQPTAP